MLRRIAVARGREPTVWLFICGCVLIAAIMVGTIIMVGEFRERAIANSEPERQNAVTAFSPDTSASSSRILRSSQSTPSPK